MAATKSTTIGMLVRTICTRDEKMSPRWLIAVNARTTNTAMTNADGTASPATMNGSRIDSPKRTGSWYVPSASATVPIDPGKTASTCSQPTAKLTPGPYARRR